MLINQKEVKRLALSLASRRAHKLTRVSKQFLERMDFALRGMIQRHIEGLPSVGKTIMALTMFLMVSGTAHAATASWYDSNSVYKEGTCRAEKCFTASGKEIHELEKNGEMFAAAAKKYPMRSKLRVTNPKTGKSVVVRVLDRGGFQKYGREVDLCKRAFSAIADPKVGVITVKVEVIK